MLEKIDSQMKDIQDQAEKKAMITRVDGLKKAVIDLNARINNPVQLQGSRQFSAHGGKRRKSRRKRKRRRSKRR